MQMISLLGLCLTWDTFALNQELVSLIYSSSEVLAVGKKLSEVHNSFIKQSTSNDWSKFISEYCLNGFINVISHKGSSIISLKHIKLGDINLW